MTQISVSASIEFPRPDRFERCQKWLFVLVPPLRRNLELPAGRVIA